MNTCANVLDLEWDQGKVIEIGITTVSLKKMEIIKTYDMLIHPDSYEGGLDRITPEVHELTGLTVGKLKKAGIPLEEAISRINEKYGGRNRLWIVDSSDEIETLNSSIAQLKVNNGLIAALSKIEPIKPIDTLNTCTLFKIKTGQLHDRHTLESMLSYYGLEFIGRQHRANDDSFNIARLFLKVMGK